MRAAISGVKARAFTIPTDRPEADGTLAWNSTTIVIALVSAHGQTGMGYTYASRAAAHLIFDVLGPAVQGRNAFDIPNCLAAMRHAARNLGVSGQVSYAISAVDTALWDLKARLLQIPLASLMGMAMDSIPVYGSGGFTTYDEAAIREQIFSWREKGITRAKIKIGSQPELDMDRVVAAQGALGAENELFVDANGAYTVKQALGFAEDFLEYGVTWFEEPVPSADLEGLERTRTQGPPGMNIAAGEYADSACYARRMLEAQAVDVLQLDATRCQGYSGFIEAAQIARAHNLPVSSHCAPALHLPVCCHLPNIVHMEYFYDHARIESMIFEGVPAVVRGRLSPFVDGTGSGLLLKEPDAMRYAA